MSACVKNVNAKTISHLQPKSGLRNGKQEMIGKHKHSIAKPNIIKKKKITMRPQLL